MTWNDLLDRINGMTNEEREQPVKFLDENDIDHDEDGWNDERKAKYCDRVANEIDNISSYMDPTDNIRKYVMTP